MFPSAQVLYPDPRHTQQYIRSVLLCQGRGWWWSVCVCVCVCVCECGGGYPRGFSWRLFTAICRSCIRSVPGRLGERHGAVCREISNLLQPTTDRFVAPMFLRSAAAAAAAAAACSSYGWRRKMIKNTWRCPDQSADSPAGYWLRAPVCHCRPSKAEHHLLRACCDENKDRRGRRGMGRRGWCVGGEMGGW